MYPEWDRCALAVDPRGLADLQLDAKVTGFSVAEIELVLDDSGISRGKSSDQ